MILLVFEVCVAFGFAGGGSVEGLFNMSLCVQQMRLHTNAHLQSMREGADQRSCKVDIDCTTSRLQALALSFIQSFVDMLTCVSSIYFIYSQKFIINLTRFRSIFALFSFYFCSIFRPFLLLLLDGIISVLDTFP